LSGADDRRRQQTRPAEVTDFDTITALFHITFVFVALAFALTARRYYDPSLYAITILFLLLQATALVAIARQQRIIRLVRPAAMLVQLLVFCAWMRVEPAYAGSLFTLFYLSVPMAAMAYRLAGSLTAALLAIGLFVWQVPGEDGVVRPVADAWNAMGTTHFIPLLLVALITGVLIRVRDQEREARYMHERVLIEYRERVELARAVQEFSLPTSLPPMPAYDVAKAFDVADYGVGGGDYYDARPLPGGLYAVCVADIAGKTISGVAKLPLVRWGFTVASEFITSPSEIASCLNALFASVIEEDSFIAAAFAVLDRDSGRVRYSVAGQVPPLVVRAGGLEAEWLDRGGPALGIVPDAEYDEGEILMGPGDILVLSSDGLIAAANASGEELGPARMVGLVKEAASGSAQEIAETLRAAARRHTGEAHRDDLVAFVIKRRRGAKREA